MLKKYMYTEKHDYANYATAFNRALVQLHSRSPQEIAHNSGANYWKNNNTFTLVALGQPLEVNYATGRVTFVGTEIQPVFPWRLIVVNYLGRARGTWAESRKWISYRELEDGQVYFPAYRRETLIPLAAFLEDKEANQIKSAIKALGGRIVPGKGDICAYFPCLPRFAISLYLWFADDELKGSVNMLYQSNGSHYLHTEDVAVLADLLAVFLKKELKACGQKGDEYEN